MPLLENGEQDLMSDGLVTINDAAAFFRISRSQIYNYIDRGLLPTVQISRSRRIPRKALIVMAAANLVVADEK